MNLPNALSLLRIFLVTPFSHCSHLPPVLPGPDHLRRCGNLGFSRWLPGPSPGTAVIARHLARPAGGQASHYRSFHFSSASKGSCPPGSQLRLFAKDLYTVLGTGVLYCAGETEVAVPSLWGKLSTLLQIVTVGFVLLSAFCTFGAGLLDGLFAVTGLATAIAFGHYLWRGVQNFSADTPEWALITSKNLSCPSTGNY